MNTSLAKCPTGIDGFDVISRGGVPRGRATLVAGGPGTGKTMFGLQFLVDGARDHDEPGMLVAFEENSQQLTANALTVGWDLCGLSAKLAIVDAQLPPDTVVAGDFDIAGLLAGVGAMARENGTRRIVFDAVDVLLDRMVDEQAIRVELFRLNAWVVASGLTAVITSKFMNEYQGAFAHYHQLEFMVDCVVTLSHRVDEGVSRREGQVIKYRGSGFSENAFPVLIGPHGLEMLPTEPPPGLDTAMSERVSTGVARLDAMLDGGYYRGSSTLVSGAPGVGKSTLASAFAAAAYARGERVLYISFDETNGEIVRNMASIGIDFDTSVASSLLRIEGLSADGQNREQHVFDVMASVRDQGVRCLVIDPVSELMRAGSYPGGVGAVQRLIRLAKAEGVTTLLTSMVANRIEEAEASSTQVSGTADTWLHISNVANGGERNRALTIVKARGTNHSNQVRELVMSDKGIDLTDVFSSGGAVLMGTARWEREEEDRRRLEARSSAAEQRRGHLRSMEADLRGRIAALQIELTTQQAELVDLDAGVDRDNRDDAVFQQEVTRMRRGDLARVETDTSGEEEPK